MLALAMMQLPGDNGSVQCKDKQPAISAVELCGVLDSGDEQSHADQSNA